jgi:nucleoid-associated protein YgaU
MMASAVSAYIQPIIPPMPPIEFPYNPGKYTIKTEGVWNSRSQPAGPGPTAQWGGLASPELDVDMLLDAFSVPPGRPEVTIAQLRQLTLPTALSKSMHSSRPPIVSFGWGPNIILEQAYVLRVTVEYQRFLLGVPVRANVTVHLRAVPLEWPLGPQNPTSGGLATQRTRTVVEGDTLASIAYQEYGKPDRWRVLAEVNNIHDPMRLKLGTVLTVPDQIEAEALS